MGYDGIGTQTTVPENEGEMTVAHQAAARRQLKAQIEQLPGRHAILRGPHQGSLGSSRSENHWPTANNLTMYRIIEAQYKVAQMISLDKTKLKLWQDIPSSRFDIDDRVVYLKQLVDFLDPDGSITGTVASAFGPSPSADQNPFAAEYRDLVSGFDEMLDRFTNFGEAKFIYAQKQWLKQNPTAQRMFDCLLPSAVASTTAAARLETSIDNLNGLKGVTGKHGRKRASDETREQSYGYGTPRPKRTRRRS